MKKFYKMAGCFLAMTMIVGLCACGSDGEVSESDGAESTEVVEEVAEDTEAKEEKTEFQVGETWTVDGQWAVTINSVKETEDRNEYADEKPAAVYLVNYTYSNLGYVDNTSLMNGLYVSFDSMIVDAEGTMGYTYPGDTTYYPQETPIGASCKAQACIGVDHAGPFTIELELYDGSYNEHKAKFIMDPAAEEVKTEIPENKVDQSGALKVGETWTVDGQWELTITDVHKTDERNEFSSQKPEAVYIVDYTYKNTGYEDETGIMDGLFMSIDSMVVDHDGEMGYSYSGDTEKYPEETPVGATCNAQACIGVNHSGDFTIVVVQYDGKSEKQMQTFVLETK